MKLLITLLIWLAMTGTGVAQVELSAFAPLLTWCASPDAASYQVKAGTQSKVYTEFWNTVDTKFQVKALEPGIYYFVVSAFDVNGSESDNSNEVAVVVAPSMTPRIELLMTPYISATQVTVVWQTDVDCSGTAMVSADKVTWKEVKANNLGTTDHLATVGGLISRTHYFYKVTGVCGTVSLTSDIRSFNTK